ncbi:hypothetical protein Dda_7478 [Drechslerella dactyloides]|uniref:Borealin N-terminal domain-containing protein n=1 Tax=Drechslerella dactyloides TaxID=74499 RepID=A0AAD6IS97_DREDA|nr:hypothetical protein Dda_7478 [Drechslerella dactyloides]
MPPIRRKKKGEDEPSEPAPAPKPTARSTATTSKAAPSTPAPPPTTASRANPLGNKTSRPINGQHPPDSAKPSSKLAVGRQNSTKQSPSKPVIKTIAIIPEPKRDPSPVSPVSPIANDCNQLSLREPSPPSAEETQIVPHDSSADAAQNRELEFQTPTSATRKRKVGRKISQFEKDRLIENIRYEVDRRAKALRQRYALQAEMLRQGIELRVGRIPYKMRNMTMGELFDRSIAAAESAKEKDHAIEARQVRKQLEDVRRLSNTATDGPALKVSKKRAIMSPPASKPSRVPNPVALKSPAPINATIKLVPQTSPTQRLPVIQPMSPEKPPSFTQKAMTGIKNKLASKKATGASSIAPPPAPTTSLRTTGKTAAASAASTAPTKKTTKATKATKAKAATASTATTTAAPKKTGGRSLRSRK